MILMFISCFKPVLFPAWRVCCVQVTNWMRLTIWRKELTLLTDSERCLSVLQGSFFWSRLVSSFPFLSFTAVLSSEDPPVARSGGNRVDFTVSQELYPRPLTKRAFPAKGEKRSHIRSGKPKSGSVVIETLWLVLCLCSRWQVSELERPLLCFVLLLFIKHLGVYCS